MYIDMYRYIDIYRYRYRYTLWIKISEKFLFYSDITQFVSFYKVCRILHGNFHTCVNSASKSCFKIQM